MTSTLQTIGATKFLDALNTAKLGASSDAEGQITIFAPNDAAFVNQPPLDASGINHHTVTGTALYSTLLLDGTKSTSLAGDSLYTTIVRGQTFINCVPILASDLLASGGVVHTVGGVWNLKHPLYEFTLINTFRLYRPSAPHRLPVNEGSAVLFSCHLAHFHTLLPL